LEGSPAEIGREVGMPDPLASARAVRALMARRRLEQVDGRYRLLDASPIAPGEPESIPRPPRHQRRRGVDASRPAGGAPGRPTYSEVGREVVERLIDLGKEAATLRANLRSAREEVRASREARDDAERRAQELATRVRELEARVDMAESNLRTILTAARGSGRDEAMGDSEMEAILGVLKGGEHAPAGDG
jgi:hypothetical protein